MTEIASLLKVTKRKKHHRSFGLGESRSLNCSQSFIRSSQSFAAFTKGSRPSTPHIETELYDNRLTFLESTLFATVLEDTATELRILAECNNELRIIKTMSDKDLLLLHKYSVAQPAVQDELDAIDPKNLKCNKYKLDKLAADRKFCTDVIIASYLDLALKRNFSGLVDVNKTTVQRNELHDILVDDEIRNKNTRKELLRQLRQQRNHCRSVIYDTDLVIEKLESQLEDANLVSEVQSRYIDNWQIARTEQNTQDIITKEAGPSSVIAYYRQRLDHEARVHTEVELLTNIYINETLNKVEDWMTKYDKDMEAIELKIQLKKNQFQMQTDTRIEMENKLAQRKVDMDNWVAFKEERERQRLYRLKMNTAAISVQAWWRGLLVRLQLGPYKPTKKKGGPPAKDQKKKK